jgi:threonine synthase
MGLELAEQFGFDVLPDVILYPTGGGTGLIGMWKAFEELELLGIRPKGSKKPRMVRLSTLFQLTALPVYASQASPGGKS